MIDGYKCRDGKVIVVNYDEDNLVTETEREYQDNIDELLKAENMEEHLCDLTSKYENEIDNYERKVSRCSVDVSNGRIIMFGGTMMGALFCVAFRSWIPVLVGFLGSFVFSKLTFINSSKKDIKKYKKEIKATELILEGIKEEQQKNQRDLRRLRNDVRVEKEDIDSNYRQFDLKELKDVDNYLELWGYVGKNEDDLLWYDEHGGMYRNLEGEFTPDEIKTLRRILKRNDKRY